MAEITNFYPVPLGRPVEQPQQRPQGRGQEQEGFQRPQPIKSTQQQNDGKAPLNVLPPNDALERLIIRAQEAQNQGQTLERGSILNLVI